MTCLVLLRCEPRNLHGPIFLLESSPTANLNRNEGLARLLYHYRRSVRTNERVLLVNDVIIVGFVSVSTRRVRVLFS